MSFAATTARPAVNLAGYLARYKSDHATLSAAPNGAAICEKTLQAFKAVGVRRKDHRESKGWNVIVRLYGPLEPWFDQTWKPSELELAN